MPKKKSETKSTLDSAESGPEQDEHSDQYVTFATLREMLLAQERIFKSIVESFVNSTISRVDTLTKDVARIEANLESTRNDFKQTKEELKTSQQTMIKIEASLEFSQRELDQYKTALKENSETLSTAMQNLNAMRTSVQKQSDKTTYLENQSRRNNIRINGIPETPGETWEQTEEMAKTILKEKLQLNFEPRFERAHRTGSSVYPDGSPRVRPKTIICKLYDWKEKEIILTQARRLKPDGIFVSEDVAEETLKKRKEQLAKLKEAKEQGKIAYFVLD